MALMSRSGRSTHSPLSLSLHGTPSLRLGGERLPLALKRGYALLAFLALEGRAVARDTLASLLWPQADTQLGRTRLRRLVYQLEDLCGRELIAAQGAGVALLRDGIDCDALAFRAAARCFVGGGAPGLSLEELDALTQQASEPMLDGVTFGSDAFDDWLQTQRVEHEHLLGRMLVRLAEAHLASGAPARAADCASRLLRLDPLSEPAHVLRMRIAADAGDAGGVEAAFDQCAASLRAEYSCAPSAATEQAYLLAREQARQTLQSSFPGVETALEVRFTDQGHATVAYATLGRGSQALVVMPGFVSHIEIAWEHPGIRDAVQRLAQRFTIVLFDRRGVGLSERVGANATVESTADDVLRILDAARIERAWLFGSSEGGPAALQLAASHPTRVQGLILFGAMARGSRADDYPWALRRDAYERWMQTLVSGWGGPADLATFAPGLAEDPATRAWWVRMLRHAVSPATLRAVLAGLRDADVRALLPRVTQPTLVMHRRDDRAVRFEAGVHLSQHIPGARFVALAGDCHWWWLGDRDRVVDEMLRFTRAAGSG